MNLPTDLTREILELAFRNDVSKARQARFVCLDWASLLKPIVFRNLKLIFSVPREELNRAMFNRLGSDDSIASLLNCVEVLDWHESDLLPPSWPHIDHWTQNGNPTEHTTCPGSTTTQLRQLQALMPRLPLTEFCWRARPRIPEWLLSSLERHLPDCAVKITLRSDHIVERSLFTTEPNIPAMESVPSLRSLQAMSSLRCLEVALAAHEPRLFHELQKVITDSPRLETLTVYAITQSYESIRYRYELNTWPWKVSAAISAFLCPRIKHLSLQNFCLCHERDSSWQQFVPWSGLRSISLTCSSFFIRLNGRLDNLVSLHLNLDNPRRSCKCLRQSLSEQVKMSLLGCQHLESLELNNISAIVDDELLKIIGAGLKTLRLHEDEWYPIRNQRYAIKEQQIHAISKHCPLLTDLAIDIEHDSNWPIETFDLIAAKLSFIRQIAFNFELGRNLRLSGGDYLRSLEGKLPQITENTARQIFHYIRRQSCSSRGLNRHLPSLETMVISRGSRDRPDKPFLYGRTGIRKRPWARLHTISLHLEFITGDGSDNSDSVKVSCPDLELLRSVSRELAILPELLHDEIRLMAKAIEIGPHFKAESVLDL